MELDKLPRITHKDRYIPVVTKINIRLTNYGSHTKAEVYEKGHKLFSVSEATDNKAYAEAFAWVENNYVVPDESSVYTKAVLDKPH